MGFETLTTETEIEIYIFIRKSVILIANTIQQRE